MKRTPSLLLFALASAALAFGQTSNSASPKEARAKSDLTQLERHTGKANALRNAAFFDRLETEEFIFTDSQGASKPTNKMSPASKRPPIPT